MRTTKIERTEPASTWTETTYGCDECDYTSCETDEVTQHVSQCHSFKKRELIGNTAWLLFEDEVHFKRYLDQPLAATGDDIPYGTWKESGWYKEVYKTGPCSRGCCTRTSTELHHKENVVKDLVSQIDKIKGTIVEIGNRLG